MKGPEPADRLHPPVEREVTHAPEHGSDPAGYDRDVNLRAVVWTAVYLAGGVIIICAFMWWLFLGLRRLERQEDPAPPPLAEEARPPLPPEPRLQSSPDEDMRALRAREDRALHEPAWIDQGQGTVRLPIDLAMDVIARRGLPAGAASPSGSAVTEAQPATAAPSPPSGRSSP